MQKNTQKDINKINQQQETGQILTKVGLTSKNLLTQSLLDRHQSNPQNKFLEIYDITSGRENGKTFKISIEKQKY